MQEEMTVRLILSLIALIGVVACTVPADEGTVPVDGGIDSAGEDTDRAAEAIAPAITGVAITDRDSFLEQVEGKSLVSLGATVVVHADGTLDFIYTDTGVRLSGTWSWRGDQFCRFLDQGSRVALTACQKMTLDGQDLIFSGHDGARTYQLL